MHPLIGLGLLLSIVGATDAFFTHSSMGLVPCAMGILLDVWAVASGALSTASSERER